MQGLGRTRHTLFSEQDLTIYLPSKIIGTLYIWSSCIFVFLLKSCLNQIVLIFPFEANFATCTTLILKGKFTQHRAQFCPWRPSHDPAVLLYINFYPWNQISADRKISILDRYPFNTWWFPWVVLHCGAYILSHSLCCCCCWLLHLYTSTTRWVELSVLNKCIFLVWGI